MLTDTQIQARDAIDHALNPDPTDPTHIVALNLLPRTPACLQAIQAKAMDLERMQKEGASPQELERMIKSMVPGLGAADAALQKAEDNYKIRIPVEAVTGRAELVKYSFTNSKALEGGQGTVTERTTIEIVHLPSSRR